MRRIRVTAWVIACAGCLFAACVGQTELPGALAAKNDPRVNGSPDAPLDPSLAQTDGLQITTFRCVRSAVHPLEAKCFWSVAADAPQTLACSLDTGETLSPCPVSGELTHRFQDKGSKTLVLQVTSGSKYVLGEAAVDVGGGWTLTTFEAVPPRGFIPFSPTFRWHIDGIGIPVTCSLDADGDAVFEQKIPNCASATATHTYSQVGSLKATLQVDDGVGTVLRKTLDITVTPVPADVTVVRTDWAQTIVAANLRLVGGKAALLRASVIADTPNTRAPLIRVRGMAGNTALGPLPLTGPAVLPTADSAAESQLFTVRLPPEWIVAGVRITVEADPDNTLEEKLETNNALEVVPEVGRGTLLPLTVVPVVYQGTTATIPTGFENAVMKVWPLQAIRVNRRAPYTFSGQLEATTGTGWEQLLSELLALRSADASTDYYYGFVRVPYGSGIAGIGYLQRRAAVGRDSIPSLPGKELETMAHELGHNFGRQHAPCGGPASPDPNYPYAGARTGSVGYDLYTSTYKSNALFDLMSYCDPTWVSDYSYNGAQRYLETLADEVNVEPAASAPTVLVYGRVGRNEVHVGTPLRIQGRPTEAEFGDYQLEVLSSQGPTVIPFRGILLGDGEEEHFAVQLPDRGEVQAVRLRYRGQIIYEDAQPVPAASTVLAQAQTESSVVAVDEGTFLAVTWDASVYPTVSVAFRQGEQRTTLALALRGGDARVPLDGVPRGTGGYFEVTLSAGLRSKSQLFPRR